MIMIRVTRKLCRLKKNHDNIPRPNTISNRELFESSNVRSYTRSFAASSRSSKNIQKMSFFKLSNYDCVGFDLDLSLVSYDINNVVRLSFELVSKFMVEKRGWDESLAASLLDTDIDFLQKGLILDLEAGNILKIASDGSILRACHGTKFMSVEELEKVYPSRRWKEIDAFVANPLEIWKDYWSLKMISLLDYFDMPVSLIFARAVDICDRKGETRPYKIWPDILDSLSNTYVAKNVKTDPSPFFLELKKNPEKYVNKQSLRTIDRLRELKKTKVTFLITGSYLDWVDLVSATALGHDWRELFDIVVCNAKKPGFFTGKKPFFKFSGIEESDKMEPGSLAKGGIYSQGNWAELEDFFRRETEKDSPKCLYVGDNLIQDVYCLGACSNWDTVVISGELQAEGMEGRADDGFASKIVKSEAWGSYFSDRFSTAKVNTLWCEIIEKYTKLCIPSLEFIVTDDFEREFQSFGKKGQETGGFYPEKPLSLRAS